MTARKRLVTVAARTATTMAAIVAVLVIVAVGAIGAGLSAGYRPVVITGGSMEPNVSDRALVVARPVNEVAVGDVLVMRGTGRATVTHRVIELQPGVDGGPTLAITRGDANPSADPAPRPLGQRELVARWVVPRLGGLVLSMATPLVGTAIIAAVVVILVTAALRRIWRPVGGTGTGHRPMLARLGPRRLGVLTVGSLVLGMAGVAWALYADQAPVPANEFSTRECFDARLGTVQSGSVVNTGAGTQTVSISAVDPTRSFLLFSVRSNSAEPGDSKVLGELASATSVTFLRSSATGSPPTMTIDWSVVSYDCGVSVQRGTAAGNGTSQVDVPISSVAVGSSFVVGSSVSSPSSSSFDGDDLASFAVTSPTNLRISALQSWAADATFGWQVITFDDPADASVQTVSTTLSSGTGTATITLPVPVDPRSTFLLAGPTTATAGPADLGNRLPRVRLVDATTIEITRLVTTGSLTVSVQAVRLADGTMVQHGVVTMNPAQTTATASIGPVDVARSTAMSTVMEPGSLSMGATDFTADDVVGEASITATLTDATTVSLHRDASASTASFAWQVVTWGGPDWADPNYPFRQRLDVTAGVVDAPDGYTTSFEIDHQSLVAGGLSLASGDDLRLWRYDGNTWIELDRVLDDASSWDDPASTVWFRTQEPISASDTVSYWIYYGNPSAAVPPADPDNVWLLREGFEGGLGRFEDRTDGTGWYQAQPWTRRMVLTVAHSAVDTTLSTQLVLVRLTSADLASHAQSDGSDIRFTAADGTTDLPHELEAYDSGTGTVTAWVLVPTVDAATDTTIHLYYGAADAPDQAEPRAVWGNELAAWHLARSRTGPAPSLDDASTNNLDGLALGDTALVDTASGPANDLDGTTDRLESSPHDIPTGPLTVSAWFEPDSVTGSPVLVSQGDPAGAGILELAVVNGTARFRLRAGGSLMDLSGGTVSTGSWHLVTATWDGTTTTLYVDGSPVASGAASGATDDGSTIAMVLGGDAAGSRTLDGRLGEVRLSSRAWSASEVRFTDQNLRNPGTTVSAGAPSGGTWFAQGSWTIRRPIVVDHTLVAGDLTDYPLLVQLSDTDLASSAQTDGDDLVFVAADGSTRLDYEIESWNGATGALTAWVRVPSLSASIDTELFLYLANPTAVDQQDPVGVWGRDADLVLNG